jgi:fructose-1,6-bisphosphatase/inositol monophosphatase family enzyme
LDSDVGHSLDSTDPRILLEPIRRLHELIREEVTSACILAFERSSLEKLAAVEREEEGDTIYAVDRISEELLIDFCGREIATIAPLVLIAEGLPDGKVILPEGASEESAAWRMIVDPIDGTRGLMYQKRSAWVLTGVARNRGDDTSLPDIELAVQTELPLVKQHLADVVWASRGDGVKAERFNRLSGERARIAIRPSHSPSIAHGFASVSRFFPGVRDELAAIDEEVVLGALGPVQPGKTHCFEDQYASTGGQLYELISGHDRFIADIRPLMQGVLKERGLPLGICCHPYDICTELIAREAGVIVTGIDGRPLDYRLAVEPDVAWIGYANVGVRLQIEPHLLSALKKRRLL